MPKPRSSGSGTKVALRLPSLPALISRLLGFFNSCQFRILTVMDFPLLLAGRAGAGSGRSGVRRWSGDAPAAGRAPKRASDAAALGRADPLVRDRRSVADRRGVAPEAPTSTVSGKG